MNPLFILPRSLRARVTTRLLRRLAATTLLLAALPALAVAQLSGTKTIGTGGDYTTFDQAVAALSAGISASVEFRILGGTYTPPAGGWVLPAVNGAGPQPGGGIFTVTFKPASGATVSIIGTTNDGTAIFAIDGGDYYIFDGSNSTGGTTRDMLLRQTSTAYGATIWVRNDADYNVLKNMTLQSTNGTGGVNVALGGVTVFVGQSTELSGNDSNRIENNLVGDPSGTYRGYRAIYIYGQSTSNVNIGTQVIGNDVVNFGNAQVNTFGIFVSYHNLGTIVRGNTVRMTTASGTSFSQAYGLYCNEQLVSPSGNTANTVFEGNRVYGLQTVQSSELIYSLAYFGDNNTNNSTVRIVNNMFASDRGTASTQYYAVYLGLTNTTSTVNVYNNSFYLGGAGSTYYLLFLSNNGSATVNHRNNVYQSTWTSGGTAVYVATSTGWTSNNNLYEINTTAASVAYFNGYHSSLSAYKTAASPQESTSISGVPQFVNPSSGDLHIDVVRPTAVESTGLPVASVPTDYDGQTRHVTAPDLGADEGNFNAGGVALARPNGGETYLGGATIPIEYSVNRAMSVRIEFTSNNGATWSTVTTQSPAAAGTYTLSFTTPDIATTSARIRVYNTLNVIEGDTSNAPFSLFQPTLTLVAPNGGEILFQSDAFPIRWTSTDIPSDKRVALDYSTNNGTSWTQIATDLPSANAPSVNRYDWTVPPVQTTQALVRVRMLDKPVSDISNATFTIRKSMNLLSPNGGEQWFVGEKQFVYWSVNRVNKLNIELSTDNGISWTPLGSGVRAFIDSFQITVPNTPTTEALVRIVNAEQPQFTERSAATFSILSTALTITAPNGGEKYELSQPVTVLWTPYIVESPLRLEYTSNGGATWTTIQTGISSGAGSFTFTPPAFPTKFARVRLIVEGRETLRDEADGPFEIMESPGISIYTPAQGEVLMAGSTYEITWGATRINTVNIEYSPTGGTPGSWQRLASNVPAGRSSFTWTVPTQVTPSGKIRIVEVGGPAIGETGLFSIVTPVPSVRVLRPNGGETYTSGTPIVIAWTASLVASVSLEFTSDGGASWRGIAGATGLPATQGSFVWTAPAPGTGYRVRVSSGGLYDDSDGNFEIVRAIVPSITVLYPNGGESFMSDSAVAITWLARDFTGDVTIDLSIDNGATWSAIDTAPAASGALNWTIPATPTAAALVRVTGGGTSDQSDASFAIVERVVPTITLLSPNTGGTIWTEGDSVTVTWQSSDIDMIDIELSSDGGATWGTAIARNIPALSASFGWRVPRLLPTPTSTMMVRIFASGAGTPADTSDQAFSYIPLIVSGIATPGITSASRLVGLFPNPASSSAEIRWEQAEAASVTLAVFTPEGRVIATDDLGQHGPGANVARFDATRLAAGVYHVELRIGVAALRSTIRVVR